MKTSDETFIVISPSEPINQTSFLLRSGIKKVIGNGFQSEFSKAHISLMKYHDTHRDSLLYHFDSIVSHFKPFKIFLKDFEILHHGSNRTICFNIINKPAIQEIFYSLTGKNITPHITIARSLSKEDFDKVWPLMQNITYSNHFLCSHLTVLKGGPGSWHHYMNLSLYN